MLTINKHKLNRIIGGGFTIFIAVLLLHTDGLTQRAQPAPPKRTTPIATTSTQKNVPLTLSSFTAKGLKNENAYTNMFIGDFKNVPFDRDNVTFLHMVGAYLDSYSRRCDKYLPTNKVEMNKQVCDTWETPVNRFGQPVGPRTCLYYRSEPSGYFADPEMLDAQKQLGQHQAANFNFLTALQGGFGLAARMLADTQAATSDMESIVQINACDSPGLKRFQANLRLFALNKQAIRLDGQGSVPTATTPRPGIPFKDRNYAWLIDDLVFEQSKTWAINKYWRGSVSRVSVTNRDGLGRPATVTAAYVFEGLGGRSEGSVTLTFEDGLPTCMYFFDNPQACRTANRMMAAAYAEGAYNGEKNPRNPGSLQ